MSKDPSTKVGAVAVTPDGKRSLCDGYNGFPPGMPDDPEIYADRPRKLEMIVHAEENLIGWAARRGVPLLGASLYVDPLHPCSRCAKLIVTAGFAEVVILDLPYAGKWAADFAIAADTLFLCRVPVRRVDPATLEL